MYNDQIPDPYFISQVKYNPEVKVSRVHNPLIDGLKEDLKLFRKSINAYIRPRHYAIQGDGPQYSGDGYREDTYRKKSYYVGQDDQYNDDEDAGSGSGDGSGKPSGSGDSETDQETDPNKKPVPTRPAYTIKPTDDFTIIDPKVINNGKHHNAATTLHSYGPLLMLTWLPIYMVQLYVT